MKRKNKKAANGIISLVLTIYMLFGTGVVNTNIFFNAADNGEVYTFNGNSYKIYSGSFTWEQAKQKCEELGGHLVTITSSEEQEFIESINNSNVWIGGYRDDNFNWFWVTGEDWSYTNWNEGEPNNSNNVVSNERYIALWPYKWNDLANSNTYEQNGFVCEWEDVDNINDNVLVYKNHKYQIFNNCETWEDAKQYCEDLGGYLAVINDSDENTALFNYMKQSGYESAYFGYSDAKSEGNWQWVNNIFSNYTNWASGEPNNESDSEDYAMFYFKYTDGKWNDGDFNGRTVRDTSAFICEWNENGYVTISFRSDTNEDMKLSHTFYYSDNLFEQKSTVFNQRLAILTLGMVMSGFSSGESDEYWNVGKDTTNDEDAIDTAQKSRTENISSAYNVLGFDKSSIEYYNYDVSLNDASDKVAFSIASKKIRINGEDKTLVAVILRGGGYGSEWSSNFNMGNNGLYHEAFNNAAWEVVNKVIDYLGKKKLTQNVKILIGGFSRAAATANLATAKLDALSNSNKLYSISRDDIYTYTFATPQGIVDNKQNDIHNGLYNNIFNIVNPTDIVPTVALSKWGFGRYGVSLTLPYVTAKSSKAANVTKKYNQLTQQNTDILQAFKVYKSGINDMDSILYKIAQNTNIFVEEKYQAVITKVLQFLYYDNNASKSVLTLQDIEKAIKNIYPNDYEMIFTNLYIYTTSSIITDLVNPENKLMIATILSIIDFETGSPERFTKDTIKKLPMAEILLCGVIVPFGNLMSGDFISFLISISSRIDYVSKAVDSISNVIYNHYPELYLSWLESYDAQELFGKKTYKKITASCPVNVDVYSDNGELLASVVNNEIIKDDIPIYLENDSKEIWLTDGDKYDIKITAYDNGTMTYSVEEYDQDFEMQNKTNFYDVPLKKNSVFETTVSSSARESVTLYDKDSKKTIYPSETLTKDAEEIEISVSCDSNGHVYGNQNVIKGEYVSVTAVPNDGYIFKGWFKENKLVSKDLEYYFNAIENINLVARFEKIKFVFGDTNGDGKVTIADSLMIARYEVKLRTLTDEQLAVSDVNYDGKVTISDALKIARYEVKLIDIL